MLNLQSCKAFPLADLFISFQRHGQISLCYLRHRFPDEELKHLTRPRPPDASAQPAAVRPQRRLRRTAAQVSQHEHG